MKNKIIKVCIILIIVISIILIANYFYKKNKITNYTQIDLTSTELNVEYDEKELTGEWSEYTGKILLEDDKVVIEGSGVKASGNSITINKAGTYYITGNIEDGNIVVDANDNDDVQIVLDNCSIISKTTAPINSINADKLTITLTDESNNVITDNDSYTEFTDTESKEPDGAIFSKTDLVINGNGNLVVNGNYSDGIVSKDDLKIINCNVEVNSEDDGIRGKDNVIINNATINVDAKGDGIKSTNAEDTTRGYIAIDGGKININASSDGIQAETVLNISGNPEINVITSGKISSSNGNEYYRGGYSNTSSSEDSSSSKGLKAGTEITIENGKIDIESTDDSIHSNGIIIINDGTIETQSNDDGIHADTNIVINNGNINVAKSYEGIESSYVEINGGTITVIASDDGINIAGGNDSSAMGGRVGQNSFSTVEDSNKKLQINGGKLTINAVGDGLDSNGAIYIAGGTINVAGPTSGGNGALDYTTGCYVSGGDIIIYGSTGMWQNPSSNSTQYCLTFGKSGNSGDEVVLKDSSGNIIKTFEAEKSYGAILISNEDIKQGETYELYINGESAGSLTVNNIITSSSSVSGNGMQMDMPGGGMNPGGGMQPGKGRR